MHKWGFYPKLALTNILRSRQFYLPYFLACTATAAMFYVLCFLTWNEMIDGMAGAASVQTILYFGVIVVALFSVVILSYTNSFVMKRRRRELGLYHILGMEKRHIARLMCNENLILGVSSILSGLLVGILLSKLILLILLKILDFSVPMGFSVSGMGVLVTAALFAGIFVLTLLENVVRISRTRPIELLHSDSIGEREPKTKWLLATLGVVTLGAGYLIANLVESPLQALALFFVAVLLVIIGTYCLFTAGSIALLKGLRANKSFYYRPKHFAAVSGMLYRMKQNAVGLASICILSTMVLVTVSTTVCLYLGTEDSLREQYPYDVELGYYFDDRSGALDLSNAAEAEQAVRTEIDRAAAETGQKVTELQDMLYLSSVFELKGDELQFEANSYDSLDSEIHIAYFQTAEEYTRLTEQAVTLAENEVLCFDVGERMPDTFVLDGETWQVVGRLGETPLDSDVADYVGNAQYFVVADNAALQRICEVQQRTRGESANTPVYTLTFNLSGDDDAQLAFMEEFNHDWHHGGSYYRTRAGSAADIYLSTGSFLFLGLFLGLLFSMAAALIIYYKQVSEGYEDRQRFAIMQKVGMSEQEVRSSVRSQILTVFFLPLGMAALHIAAAFNLIRRLLTLFSLTNWALFAGCTVGTLLCFALLYLLVYRATAKTYYKIVSVRT